MGTDSHWPKPRRRGLRILCADDHTMIGEVLVRLFSDAGHEVEHVGDGVAAWQRLAEDPSRFDVVVTDQQMPGLRGDELVELLRQVDFNGRIIVHSSRLSRPEVDRLNELRVDHIVYKSSRPEELLAIIEAFHEQ